MNRQAPVRICEDCDGSGVCAECRGEGFVLKKMSDENAERARLMAKNAATRYTAGYVCFRLILIHMLRALDT